MSAFPSDIRETPQIGYWCSNLKKTENAADRDGVPMMGVYTSSSNCPNCEGWVSNVFDN